MSYSDVEIEAVVAAPAVISRKYTRVLDLGASTSLRAQYPPRTVPAAWPQTTRAAEAIYGDLLSERAVPDRRDLGIKWMFDWLSAFDGASWQDRWRNSGVEQTRARAWLELPGRGLAGSSAYVQDWLRQGLRRLMAADVIRPSLGWLARYTSFNMIYVARLRDPDGIKMIEAVAAQAQASADARRCAPRLASVVLIAKGGNVADITVGDVWETVEAFRFHTSNMAGGGRTLFYHCLKAAGVLPADAPTSIRMFDLPDRRTPAELVEQYDVKAPQIRRLFIEYLQERQPALDFSSLKDLALMLVRQFWCDLEAHHPGIDSLALAPDVAAQWRQRATVKATIVKDANGAATVVHSPRHTANSILTAVRAFYLDVGEWAMSEPARWGPFAAPSPVQAKHLSKRKHRLQTKSRMDQRTRERMPLLPVLVRAAHEQLRNATQLLAMARTADLGGDFTFDGKAFHRLRQPHSSGRKLRIRDLGSGRERDVAHEESAAFWAWAAIEVLRLTGIRIEELLELSHHAVVQYRLPDTGEIIPLLQIVPSKGDAERLLVVSPELADVLSAIITRARVDGAVPLVTAYDTHEQVWNPPSPLLFQRIVASEHRPFRPATIRLLISQTAIAAGIDVSFWPHDFRRIFVTDAIMSGLPPHIAQVLCGHADINTTMGYKAVYPQEAIDAYRAFLARRRAIRPATEYRPVSDEEWEEFLGHFIKRKVALGDCGRAFQAPCIHEHACIRCPMLRPDPTQRHRMTEIQLNLTQRITEAQDNGWLGEVEGLNVSLAAVAEKLTQLDNMLERKILLHIGPRPS